MGAAAGAVTTRTAALLSEFAGAAPDGSPLTMMLLASPMYVLFESSIWIIVLLEKSWKRSALTP